MKIFESLTSFTALHSSTHSFALPPSEVHELRRWQKIIIIFRLLWAGLLIFGINSVLELGTSPAIVSISAGAGIILGTALAFSRMNWVGASLSIFSVWAVYFSLLWSLDSFASQILPRYFALDALHFHLLLCLAVASFGFVSTWFFWRVRTAVTVEAIALSLLCITLFSGHRGFHFDRPKIVNSLAWQLRADHLSMLLCIGAVLLIASTAYIAIASRALRPHAQRGITRTSSSGWNLPLLSVVTCILIATISGVLMFLYNHFSASMLARVANGVGMESKPGVSPLTFQSALGSTNQPSALVRLEGDYAHNPYSPMLYLRENALSAFNGHEMVIAGRAYDSDLPAITPRDSFTGTEDGELTARTPLVQSIYPLADHQNAFAVDYPLSIVQLKNPQPNRFKASYRAYSSAPGFQLSEINTSSVGDSRWTEDIRRHYLTQHPDVRYSELALSVTKDITHPVEKVTALANYLSKTSIYTLTPNHDVKKEEDQVAPFLFGDHRGYCVHFAHAMVYMARALGIPSRVGTGYLTDLSQSKDGHILLLMSDRHAWAEVYVEKYGWLPFDVQPEQVESHADNKVDPKLLEELMGMLEPGEEILPQDSVKDEPGMEEVRTSWLPGRNSILIACISLVSLIVVLKVVLLHGWRLIPHPRYRARWAYTAVLLRLADMGVARGYGETRSEFSCRIANGYAQPLTHVVLRIVYGPHATTISKAEVDTAIARACEYFKTLPIWQRCVSVLNPASVLSFIVTRRQ